jgi:hypothetical protein
VLPFPRPAAQTSTADVSYVAAGLVVKDGNNQFIRLMRAAEAEDRNPRPYIHWEFHQSVPPGGNIGIIPDGACYLQIERRGNKLLLRYSVDGKAWSTPVAPSNLNLASRIKIGVGAINAVKTERTFKFEDFQIERRESGWVPLFNGKDLTGWKQAFADSWVVEQGELVSRVATDAPKNNGVLQTERIDYKDFHLRSDVKVNKRGDSGVLFRGLPGENPGYQVQIFNGPGEAVTGTLLYKRPSEWLHIVKRPLAADDTWFMLEVIAQGTHIVIKVDGTTVVDVRDSTYARGYITLESGRPGTVVRFRNIEIKELPPTEPASARPLDAQSGDATEAR